MENYVKLKNFSGQKSQRGSKQVLVGKLCENDAFQRKSRQGFEQVLERNYVKMKNVRGQKS